GPEENTSGSTAYPTAKARRDNSMPTKRGASEDVYGAASRDPRDKVKATLLEPQPAAVTQMTSRLPRPSRDHRHTADSVPPPEAFRPVRGGPRGRSRGRTARLRH